MENLKIEWITYLRSIATIAVITTHLCFKTNDLIGSYSWWVSNSIYSSVRFCVPVFLMITGALMLGREYQITDFIKRKFIGIFVPFILWGIVYLAIDAFIAIDNLNLFNFVNIPIKVFNDFIFYKDNPYHFWYLYMLCGLYLFLPILGKWTVYASKKDLEYFLIIWLITIILGTTKRSTLLIGTFNLISFSGYVGFLVLGYYLFKYCTLTHRKIISILFIISGFLTTVFGTWVFSLKKGITHHSLHSYISINVIILSIGVFLLVQQTGFIRNNFVKKTNNLVSRHPYGIFLVHVLVINTLEHLGFGLNFWTINDRFPLSGIFCMTFSVTLLSTLIIHLISRFRIGEFITGENRYSITHK